MSVPPNQPGQSDPYQAGQWWQPPPPPLPPPPKGKPVALWVGLAVVLVVVAGAIIGVVIELGSETDPPPPSAAQTGETKVVTATDNKSQLTVPKNWIELPEAFSSEVAVIQMAEPMRERYVMVVTGDKGDFADFEAFQNAVVDGTTAMASDAEVGDAATLTVGGLPAVRREVSGTVDGVKVVFWWTMVDGKNGYYQVITWTLPSKKDEAKPVLDEVVNSFRETPPS